MGNQCSNTLCIRPQSSQSSTAVFFEAKESRLRKGHSASTVSSEKLKRLDKGRTMIQPEDADPEDLSENIQKVMSSSDSSQIGRRGQVEPTEYFDAVSSLPSKDELYQSTTKGSHSLVSKEPNHLVKQATNFSSDYNRQSTGFESMGDSVTIPMYNISRKNTSQDVRSNFQRMNSAHRELPLGEIRRSNSRRYVHTPSIALDQRQLNLTNFGNEGLRMLKGLCNKTFNDYEEVHYSKKSPHQLKIFYKNYDLQNRKIHSFQFEYYINCTPEQYGDFSENFIEQKSLDPGVEFFNLLEDIPFDGKTHSAVYYLAYPKIVVSKGREFVYIKTSEYGKDSYRDVSRSIDHHLMPENNHHVRAEMILCGNTAVKADDPKTGKKRCKVRSIAETDVKASVPAFIVKQVAKSNLKKIVERTVSRIEEIYR